MSAIQRIKHRLSRFRKPNGWGTVILLVLDRALVAWEDTDFLKEKTKDMTWLQHVEAFFVSGKGQLAVLVAGLTYIAYLLVRPDKQVIAAPTMQSPTLPEPQAKQISVLPDADDSALPSGDDYLADHDSDLSAAVRDMAFGSAWGRSFSARQLDQNGHRDDLGLMDAAALKVGDALANGQLRARGALKDGVIAYETIPPERWRFAALQPYEDARVLWEVKVVPSVGVDPDRLGNLLAYDSILVNSVQFLRLFPTKNAVNDVARRMHLENAKRSGVDPALWETLADER